MANKRESTQFNLGDFTQAVMGNDRLRLGAICVVVLLIVLCLFGIVSCSKSCSNATDAANNGAQNVEAAENSEASAEEETSEPEEISEHEAEMLAAQKDGKFVYASNVPEVIQYPYEAGCEPASLTCALQSMGYDLTFDDLVENYLVYSEDDDWVYGYNGDIYTMGMTYPPCIVSSANNYLEAQGSTLRFKNLTGSTFDELLALVERGAPVCVWTTMYMAEPMFTGIESDGYEFYENEHCVVVYGVDGDDVLVMDPLIGYISRDREWFEEIYDECGQAACGLDV